MPSWSTHTPGWQGAGQSHSGNQVYYNPNKSSQWALSHDSNGSQSTFQVKAGNIAVKYKGDPDSSLAQTAAQIALLAVTSQRR